MAPFHAVTVFHLVTQGTVAECLNSTKTSPGIKHTSIALICFRQDRPGSAIKSFYLHSQDWEMLGALKILLILGKFKSA